MSVVAVLVGLQASGKTTFTRQVLGAGYLHVSKDHFPNARNRQRRQMRLITEALDAGRSVAVDNTNPSPAEWKPLIEAARQADVRAVAYWFPPDVRGSMQRNAARTPRERVPEAGIRATFARLRAPNTADGFDEVLTVRFDGKGGFDVGPSASEGGSGER